MNKICTALKITCCVSYVDETRKQQRLNNIEFMKKLSNLK
jgi:hypothetical protein